MLEALIGTLLGFLSGMRHALEPDHIAAVSTVLAEQRTARSSVLYASLWGTGHALMLILVGGSLYALRHQMPERIADLFEVAVAAMLIFLGVRALLSARSRVGKSELTHTHGPLDRPHSHSSSVRPLGIGLVHGLAGSGALTALVVSKSMSLSGGLGFMVVYGIGAALGMVALAGVLGLPLSRLARDARWEKGLLAASGTLALVIGVVWGLRSLHLV